MAPSVFLVRHAPTASNRAGVFQGQLDVPALPLLDVAPIPLTIFSRQVFSSPLQRARTAAQALFPGEKATLDVRLLERSVGAWEGLDHATVRRRWPASYRDGAIDPAVTPPGGEDLRGFAERVASFLRDLATIHDEEAYVITHNGWIRMALLLRGVVAADDLFAEPTPFLVPLRFNPLQLRTADEALSR